MEGITQSRRDDLESLFYVLMYLLKGKLPWQNILIKNKEERYNKIKEIKKNIKIEELCDECPKEFNEYIKYIKSLKYEEDPNYFMLKNLFFNLLSNLGYKFDYYYDWDKRHNTIEINKEFLLIDKLSTKMKESFNNDEDNKLNLPLNKIIYKKLYKKRNKSQDKSTNDGGEELNEKTSDYNNSSNEQLLLNNNNECCIII